MMEVTNSGWEVGRCGKGLAQFCCIHLVIAPICPSEETAAAFEGNTMRRNHTGCNPHHEHNVAIIARDLAHLKIGHPWIDTITELILNPTKGFIEPTTVDPDNIGGNPIFIFTDTDDDITPVRIGERRHICKKVSNALIIGSRKGFLEVKCRPFAPRIGHEIFDIV
ncbi:hypothetical protein FBZ86_1441 [Gluconacetobacter diazotrophicus]|nr:hypothetical protein FBZ86_1441 [Gluconacetobacter diazotrophicus]